MPREPGDDLVLQHLVGELRGVELIVNHQVVDTFLQHQVVGRMT